MNYIKAYYIYKKYIEELMRTQMLNSSPVIQDIFNKKDYDKILNGVLEVIRENPHANLTTLRLILFQKSGLKEIMDKFVNETKITPGVVLDFGTFKTRDTVICGKCQEYTMQNGILVPDEKEIEHKVDSNYFAEAFSERFTGRLLNLLLSPFHVPESVINGITKATKPQKIAMKIGTSKVGKTLKYINKITDTS